MQGTEVLARSREVYPLARRVLLTAYSDIDAAIKAINEAHLDHYLVEAVGSAGRTPLPGDRRSARRVAGRVSARSEGLRLVGHQWSPRSHAIKNFLAGNLIPYRWLDVERNPDARGLLDAAGVAPRGSSGAVLRRRIRAAQSRAPAGGRAPRTPALGRLRSVRPGDRRRRSGRARGRGVRRLRRAADAVARRARAGRPGRQQFPDRELPRVSRRRQRQRTDAPGGDAGAAARRGVSGAARGDGRVDRRGIQAPHARATAARSSRAPCSPRPAWPTASIRRPAIAEHTGAGVYYGAATTEAPVFAGRRVVVVGGGNSAGQSAMHLARYAKDVQIVVRRDSLRDTMSQYLIDQIDKTAEHPAAGPDGARARRRQRPRRTRRVPIGGTTARLRWRRSMPSSCSSARSRAATGCPPASCATRRGSC